jgi:hypothetical protein
VRVVLLDRRNNYLVLKCHVVSLPYSSIRM